MERRPESTPRLATPLRARLIQQRRSAQLIRSAQVTRLPGDRHQLHPRTSGAEFPLPAASLRQPLPVPMSRTRMLQTTDRRRIGAPTRRKVGRHSSVLPEQNVHTPRWRGPILHLPAPEVKHSRRIPAAPRQLTRRSPAPQGSAGAVDTPAGESVSPTGCSTWNAATPWWSPSNRTPSRARSRLDDAPTRRAVRRVEIRGRQGRAPASPSEKQRRRPRRRDVQRTTPGAIPDPIGVPSRQRIEMGSPRPT